jgi:hypothetical protein
MLATIGISAASATSFSIAAALPDGTEQVLVLAQTDLTEALALQLLVDVVHHLVDAEHPDDLVVDVDDRRGAQVITLEGLHRVTRRFVGVECHRLQQHHLGDHRLRVMDQQPLHRQHPLQGPGAVDDDDLIDLLGQVLALAQVAQHDLDLDVVTNADDVEIHQRAYRALGKGQHALQFGAFPAVHRIEQFEDRVAWQVGHEIGDLVGIQVLGRIDDVAAGHHL